MKQSVYLERVNHLQWLYDIRSQYEGYLLRIDCDREHFTVTGIGYEARGDGEVMHINPHRSIPVSFIYDGVKAALDGVQNEITELETQLKRTIVEL